MDKYRKESKENVQKVVHKYPAYKSLDVEGSHEHKLWWVDIELLDDGRYQVTTYAQLFMVRDRIVEGLEVRRYPCDIKKTLDRAMDCANTRIGKKMSASKGYSHFMDRSGSDLEIDIEIAKAFLNKYAGLH